MEEEQGSLSTVGVEGFISLRDETLTEHMGGEKQIEDSYALEDGGEIMVEIVGSDVVVHGVGSSSNKEGVSMSADIGDLDSHILVNREENNTQNCFVSQRVEVKYCESVSVYEISSHEDKKVENNSANANHGSSELLNDPIEASVVEEIGGAEVDTDEREIKDEAIGSNGFSANIVTPDHLNDPVEALTEGETGVTLMATEESAIKGEGAVSNSSNDQNIEVSEVKVVSAYKPSENGKRIDTVTENIRLSANDAEFQIAEINPVVNAETEIDNLVEEFGSPQSKEVEVSLQNTETAHDGIDMPDNISLLQKEVAAETEQLSDQVVYSRKRKALDPLTHGSDKRENFNAAKISASADQTPKPTFKIGECILRVASQLTGATSTINVPTDEVGSNGSPKMNEISAESSPIVDMLSQLQLVAQDPNKPHKFRDEIITFFSGYRSSILVNKRVRKKKSGKSVGGSAEEFEFDDANDSYWRERVVENYYEKQLPRNNENGEEKLQLAVPLDEENPVKSVRKPVSRKKRYFTGNIPNASEEIEEKVKRVKQESSPAELILNFAEKKCVPSEINLNKTFRRFGPLMESETEVDHGSGRARVIFKRGSDAEVAHNSALKFNIFGPVLVNYQIGYSPLISVKISPLEMSQS